MSTHLVTELYLFDFTPTISQEACVRCGYAPRAGAHGIREINLWAATGITTLAGQRWRESRWDDDPRILDVAADDMVWATLCGGCVDRLDRDGSKYPCIPTTVETD